MPNETQLAAENYVYEQAKKKPDIADVEDKRSSHEGYDFLFIYRDQHREKVEVKGNAEDRGIPDMRTSEFKDKKLKADFLYLIAYAKRPKKKIYIIPANEIKPENLKELSTYRIRGFGKRNLSRFVSSF
jgi:Protein NO VEIN, C-terminal